MADGTVVKMLVASVFPGSLAHIRGSMSIGITWLMALAIVSVTFSCCMIRMRKLVEFGRC